MPDAPNDHAGVCVNTIRSGRHNPIAGVIRAIWSERAAEKRYLKLARDLKKNTRPTPLRDVNLTSRQGPPPLGQNEEEQGQKARKGGY